VKKISITKDRVLLKYMFRKKILHDLYKDDIEEILFLTGNLNVAWFIIKPKKSKEIKLRIEGMIYYPVEDVQVIKKLRLTEFQNIYTQHRFDTKTRRIISLPPYQTYYNSNN
jgi:hypothetical protein